VLLVIIVVAAALLIWLASLAQTRRATGVAPVDALAVEYRRILRRDEPSTRRPP
jgi:hypothetical protein